MRSTALPRFVAILAFLVAVAAFAAGVWWYAYIAALEQLDRRAEADLALASDNLGGELRRFRELAVITADRPNVLAVLKGLQDPQILQPILREIADKTGSLDINVVDVTGRELAAAEPIPPNASHAGLPYFQRAMDGALGVYHHYSERYGRRAFVFAAPVFSPEGPVIGAVIVAVDIAEIEAPWRADQPTVYFTDDLGVVFVANRSELVFRARGGDSQTAARSDEYLTGQIAPFVRFDPGMVSGFEIWTVDGGRYLPRRALHLVQEQPEFGLTGEMLMDVAPARQLASLQAAAAAALCLAFGALLFLATERRRTLAIANLRLEQRVANRTAELSALNESLRREVAERAAAEERLRRAQADLVQAGKLSALGQMSAGISHELNQPLMAIGSFAENAVGFLERGQTDIAGQNLSRISDLARRMGRIIRNLRAFARQESEPIGNVDLLAVVDVVLEMAAPRMAETGTHLTWDRPIDAIVVRGGEVRLQQVLLNLLMNAIDAMIGLDAPGVTIAVRAQGARAELTVRDNGPGITAPEKIFDPFYSTKAVGDGMGLGLSISYGLVQSFGGDIRGRNYADGGAVFTVLLDLATPEGMT